MSVENSKCISNIPKPVRVAVGLPLAALSMIVGAAIVYFIRKKSRKLPVQATTRNNKSMLESTKYLCESS